MVSLLLASLLAAEPPVAPPAPPGPQPAQTGPQPAQTEEERKKLEEEISKELGATPGQAPPVAAPPGATAPQPVPPQGVTGGSPFARLLLLPDISVIGDFAAAYDSYDVPLDSPRRAGDPFSRPHQVTPQFQELELGFQSVIDPYARADIFISFSPSGVDVEEAYLTTLTLPYGLQLRAGQFFSPYGRLNQQHPHIWDFVDAPLAMARLVATDVLSGPGADLAWLAPLPWFAELHVAYQMTTPPFQDVSQRTGLARLVQFFDLSDAAALGAGLSGVLSASGPGPRRELLGTDLFVKIRPPTARAYVALQGELFVQHVDDAASPGTHAGGYLQAVWRESPFFEYGARWEIAPAARPDGELYDHEQRVSGLATWLPSEFQRYRVQLAWDQRPGSSSGLEAILHAEFIIGAHGAHPF